MLLELHIKNYALIDELHLTFHSGLTVFTGETGAGKSILIEALNQVLGERADTTTIRTGAETSTVEAIFDIKTLKNMHKTIEELGYELDDPDSLLLRRELSRTGRNRCWIGGQLATLSILQQIGEVLVDMHGQHEHQSFLKTAKQMDVLDEYGDCWKVREQVSIIFHQVQSIREELRLLKASDTEKNTRREMYEHQINEIENAQLSPEDEELLTQQKQVLQHYEKLLRLTHLISLELNGEEHSSSNGLLLALGRIRTALLDLKGIDTGFEGILSILEPVEISMTSLNQEILYYQSKINLDPQILEQVEEKLDFIHRLKRKYKTTTLLELLALMDKWKEELEGLSHQEERLEQLEKKLISLNTELGVSVIELSSKRQKSALKLSKEIESELTELGMPHTTFQIQVQPREDESGWLKYKGKTYIATSAGIDHVEFYFSANPGEPVRPLSRTISGGELSRVMLALKTIFATADKIPTLIFDEIDVGIGGAMASVVGRKLREISELRQVLTITHLPAIAASGDTHYQVTKEQDTKRTLAHIKELTKEDRIREIARMTSGDWLSATSLDHATELLEQSARKETKKSRASKKATGKKSSS